MFLVFCPEQSLRQVLPHTWAIARLQGVPGKILGLVYCLERVQPMCDKPGDAGGQRASRAVVAVWQSLPGKRFKQPVSLVKLVDNVRGSFVGAGYQHIFGAKVQQRQGARIQGVGSRCQQSRFLAVRCYDGRAGFFRGCR